MNIQEIIEKTELKQGSHKNFEEGSCVMELVSYLANEPWSDRPKCACPVLTGYAIRINDRFDNETRQRLKPLIPKLLNSRADRATEKKRYEFIAHRAITVFLSALTEALGLIEITKKLKSFKIGEWNEAKEYIYSVRPLIRETARKRAAAAYAADAAAAAYAADKQFWLDQKKKYQDYAIETLSLAADIE